MKSKKNNEQLNIETSTPVVENLRESDTSEETIQPVLSDAELTKTAPNADEVVSNAADEVVSDTADDKQKSETATEEAEDVLNPRKNKKSNIWGNIFCILSIALALAAMYLVASKMTRDNAKPFVDVLKEINVTYLLLSIGTVLLMIVLDSLKYVVIMWATGVNIHYPTALKVSLLGKYYDDITPFSSGGQPMQIYYLHKKGLNGGKSSGVIMVKMAFNMMIWLTTCCLLMLLNKSALTTYVKSSTQLTTFTVMGWIGFGVNCFLPFAILLFALFPRMIEAIAKWLLAVGHKLKLVKDKDVAFARAKKGVTEFKSSFVSMIKKPLQSLILIVVCASEIFLGMMLPYFAVVTLGGKAVAQMAGPELMFAIMTLNVYASMTATVIPTPGNTGGIETVFMLTLSSILEGTLFWSVLGWRILSYYVYILIGLTMTVVQLARKNRTKKTLL